MNAVDTTLLGAACAAWGAVGGVLIAGDGLEPIEDCAMSMAEARVEDELCVTWLDENEHVVFGPLWARPAQKGN